MCEGAPLFWANVGAVLSPPGLPGRTSASWPASHLSLTHLPLLSCVLSQLPVPGTLSFSVIIPSPFGATQMSKWKQTNKNVLTVTKLAYSDDLPPPPPFHNSPKLLNFLCILKALGEEPVYGISLVDSAFV